MIITMSLRLKEFYDQHPDAEASLQRWNQLTGSANWQNFVDLRGTFSSADLVGKLTVFNISGNKYRLITYIDFKEQEVYILNVLTHAEYDKGKWKEG